MSESYEAVQKRINEIRDEDASLLERLSRNNNKLDKLYALRDRVYREK